MEKSREDEEVGREGPIAAPRTAGEDKAEVVESSDAEETDTVLELPDQASEKPDEEEKSLLDPPKTQKIQPQTISSVPEERQGPKSRLVIHKMALVNFKSYAGRQEIGPFHKSFSAIVGPNGSGKSNTIDALLFVFGYRASKMRQGKLSELIHNSARYPDLDECSVEIHFRDIMDLPGPDAFEVVPGSDIVVARTAYKGNSSKYTINGKQSNYKEVQTLLKGRGIDLDHNRFLILQGEVESIAQMKPKAPNEHEDGLLEYLEDIIGTSQYKEPIEEALVEMERLSEDRQEKLNRLRIVEKDRNALEAKKKEAEDYLRMQNEHVRALSRLWQYYLWTCFVNEDAFDKNIARLEKELASERERNKDDILHLEALEKHYNERVAAYEEVKAAAAEATKDLAAHEKRQVGLDERRKHASSKAKKLKKSLQEDEHNRTQALHAIEDNTGRMDKEKKKVEELEESLAREEDVLEEIRDSLKDKTQVFHDKIEIKQKELQPWTAKINAKQAEIDLATNERDMLAKKAEAAKVASKEAQDQLEQLRADNKAKACLFSHGRLIVAELEELKTTKANSAAGLKAKEKQAQDLHARVQQLRSKADSTRQKASEAKASQAADGVRGNVLSSLTRLRQQGRISGFHGRLGSLGTIPDKYDVAVSTACGALNNLVVDTVDQGQACIEYLRTQKIGRASFMVLEKLRSDNMNKISTPENVPRLFDLIKPKEPRFAAAFYKGVGNTLVAENLEQANRIAFGSQRRWRVVTLAGQLIDSSGTMSGGGTHVMRGGMSSKLQAEAVAPEVIKQYERDSEEAARELEGLQQQLRQVEAELDNIQRSGPQLDMAIEKVTLDLRTATKRIADAEKRVRDLKAQMKPDASDVSRISALEKQIDAHTSELESLQEKTEAIQEEIKALEKKILEIGGARLLSQKSKVDGIRLQINIANDEITKAEVAKAKAEKDAVKFEGTIESNRTTLDEVTTELEELNGQIEEITTYVEELRSKVEAAQAAVENSKDDLENLKGELDVKTEEIQAFRAKQMELTQSLADTKKEAAENQRALEHWRDEHDKLKLEEVDDDDDEEENEVTSKEGDVKREPGEGHQREKTPAFELHVYSEEELSQFKKSHLIADAELLDEKLKNSKPDLSVLKDYRKREEEFFKRASDLEEVTKLRDGKKAEYDSLRKQRLDEFMTGFNTISLKLKEMYQMITLGGNAELELVDSMDPFSEGIIFSVMPPKKSWKNISNLSGGEKTLSSLALVFALHVYKPTPLYFMDEIDAALDFRNVSIVANYIKDRTKNAQFIIISLRNDMFELSHRLIGIYKTANQTRSISIDNQPLHTIPLNAMTT
ncbi:RecF/RecN/SMC [Fomitopsis betulina]|nr:RecF/RecN/SMC [Fomitopsis betulina]